MVTSVDISFDGIPWFSREILCFHKVMFSCSPWGGTGIWELAMVLCDSGFGSAVVQ